MTLAFTLVVSISIICMSVLVAVVEIHDPKVDTSGLVRALTTIMTLILGSLLGLLAGKTSAAEGLAKRPPGAHRAPETSEAPEKEAE